MPRADTGTTMTNKLDPRALDWALIHIDLQGDTDLFPRPFEIDAMKAAWPTLISDLSNLDITNHPWQAGRKVLLLKDDRSFRSASQLDPLDSLLFAAIVRQIGEQVEAHRSPLLNEAVFSYRFAPTPAGHLYGDESRWDAFWQVSIAHAYRCNYVVTTDLTDFYNQISHHTIERELLTCRIASHLRSAIMNLLRNFTQGVSRGIPVGPHPSHLLAELSLVPTDEVMRLKGYTFCRYADDVHIFCANREEAQVALYELADTLDKSQRLSLSRHKTHILANEQFIERATNALMETPINDEERQILEIIGTRADSPYDAIRLSELAPEEVRAFSKQRIEKILMAYLASEFANVVRIRWFLRRLAQVGSPGGVEMIVKNLNLFLPAVGEATRYLSSARDSYGGEWPAIGAELLGSLALPIVKRSEYLQIVLLSLYSRIAPLDHVDSLVQRFDGMGPSARRKVVLAATEAGAAAWLRGFKDGYTGLDPWLRRAVIYSAKTFPIEERRYWLRMVKERASLLERAVVESIR